MTEKIKVEKTLGELLQEVRYELTKAELKKTGYNSFQKYNYFELKDFLPLATKLFYERGICPIYNIVVENGIEYAVMTLTKGAESISFREPTAEATNSQNPIQNAGSKDSYMRRYMYVNHVLDLVEDDPVDSADNSKVEKVEEKKATEKQIEMIARLYDSENIAKMLEYYNINELSELSLKQASEVIARKQKNERNS